MANPPMKTVHKTFISEYFLSKQTQAVDSVIGIMVVSDLISDVVDGVVTVVSVLTFDVFNNVVMVVSVLTFDVVGVLRG